jgi:NAD(P)-dependent dehydrogenase (short-subunit alcohol dehydrogenase family)
VNLGLDGRRAVVTGASRGIGAAVARGLAAEGAVVLAVARRSAPLHDLCRDVERRGGAIQPIVADVAVATGVARIVDVGIGVGATVDILVNNVGRATTKPVLEIDDADWQDAFERNLFSAVRLTRAFVPGMVASGWGRVVHVSSIAAREPGKDAAAYAAAKAALVAYSKALSSAIGRHGVLSSAVLPGATLTDGFRGEAAVLAERHGLGPDEALARVMGRRQPAIHRPSTADEVASAVMFLCSEAASAITGVSLPVDGGTVLGAW